MPRPKTKPDLLEQSSLQYDKLMDIIASLSDEDLSQEFPERYMNRNIRDVICHLHEWHKMFLTWYEIGMKGERPEMPAPGHTWKTTPDLNREINQQYCTTPLAEAIDLFSTSHAEVTMLIESHTDEELFEKKRYKWTGSTSMGQYLVSSTSSHYDWANKLIIKALSLNNKPQL